MKTASILRSTVYAGALTLGLGLQAALAAPFVYVPLGDEGRIAIVDAAKDKITGSIGGTAAVHGLARTPDGQFLIAGSLEERDPGGMAPEKPAGVSAANHAAHHSAASQDNSKNDAAVSTVTVIRVFDGSVVRRIDVPGSVHHVAVGPGGRYAVVTHPGEGSVSVIDLSTYSVVSTIPTGSMPNYAVFSPDGKRVYVSNGGNDTVTEIDAGQWAVRRNIAAGETPGHMVTSRDGQRLYVANSDAGTVSEIAANTGATVSTFKVGGSLHGIDLSDDGSTLFVSALGRDKLVAINLQTAKEREIPLSPAPYHIATIRGTGKLYVSSAGKPDVWVVDQKKLAVIGKITIGGKGHQMVLSPGS